MKILVINCGSSSIKYKLYVFPKRKLLARGFIEKIGEENSPIKNHSQGIKKVFSSLLDEKVISKVKEISLIGHRVVHGGETFRAPHIIDNTVIKKIKDMAEDFNVFRGIIR